MLQKLHHIAYRCRDAQETVDFYTKVIGKDYAQVKSRWAQLVFTGKGAAPKELAGGEDVVKAVAADPHAIAYVDRSFVNITVKVIYTVK